MQIKHIMNIKSGQDGAIFKDFIFRFEADGKGFVYSIKGFFEQVGEPVMLEPIAEIELDKRDLIIPHSNSVVFGNEYYEEGDEFPLLYTNVYNNYAKAENKQVGVCCAYRIIRDGDNFKTALVGIIEIGFTDDRELWRSEGDALDVRPYGNFVIDTENSKYYAFVMRDLDKKTRFFEFDLPSVKDGEYDSAYGVNRVTLKKEDIKRYFDTPYMNYMQGAVLYNGKIYSVEGFNENVRSSFRMIDLKTESEQIYFDFCDAGYPKEPEFIDFYIGRCIYGDASGRLFELIF